MGSLRHATGHFAQIVTVPMVWLAPLSP